MPRRHSRFLWILLLCSFAFRLSWLIAYPLVIENEGAQYARLAQNLLSGSGYQDMRGPTTIITPLYSVLMAGVSILTRNMELSGRLISLLLGSLLPLVVYLVVDRIYGRETAWVAGLFAVAHPLLIALSASVYSEGIYIFCLLAALYWTLVVFQETRFGAAVLAGVFAGLAYLIRPEALLYAFLFAVWVDAAAWFVHSGFRTAWRRSIALACATLVVAAPFIWFLSVDVGHFSWEGKSSTNDVLSLRLSQGISYQQASAGLGPNLQNTGIFLLNDDRLIEKYYPVSFSQKVHLLTHGLLSRSVALMRILFHASYLGSPLIFLVAIAGLLGGPWNKIRIAHEALLCCMAVLLFLILTSMHFIWDRFLFVVLPVVLIWAARGAVNCASWISNAVSRLRLLGGENSSEGLRTVVSSRAEALACPIFLFAILLSAMHVGGLGEFAESRWIQEKNAGRWIASHAPASRKPVVMALDVIAPYYAGATARLLPTADSVMAIGYVHSVNPDFVILWGQERFQRSYVEEWMLKGIPDSCAEPVYQEGNSIDDHVLVYAWTCVGSEHQSQMIQSIHPLLQRSTSRE